jgi:hypothetical protein
MMSFSKISAQVYNTLIRIYHQALQTLLVICYQDKMGYYTVTVPYMYHIP